MLCLTQVPRVLVMVPRLTVGTCARESPVVSPAGGGYPCLNTHWVQVMAFDKMTGTRTHGYSPVLHLNEDREGYCYCDELLGKQSHPNPKVSGERWILI